MELIDKNALVKYLEGMGNEIYAVNDEYFLGQKTGLAKAVSVILTFPTVEERKHGHWITKKAWHVECSECHHVLEFICDVKKYCPNCGAIMDGKAICND